MPWLAVYSRPNAEETVAQKLRSKTTVFYPFVREVKRIRRGRTSRLVKLERAYFTRYLFAEYDPWIVHEIKEIKEALAVVSVRGEPLEIPDKVIDAIRALGDPSGCMEDRDFTKPSERFKARVGDVVGLVWPSSPLNGLLVKLASVSRLDSHNEVSVFVRMLGSEREVRVPARVVSAAAAVG